MNAQFFKELMDRTGAAIGLVLLSPVFLVLILLVRRDGGPAFFGHPRLGHDGRMFKCWKFRSMAVDARAALERLLAADPEARKEWEETFKLKNDPRVTKIGAFLRKTSLDELPQLYNVLCGEMSLVGPRPIVEDERKFYGEDIHTYMSVKPGMTGLWQVSGRSNASYADRVQLDKLYVAGWSLWNDISIIFRTFSVVLLRKGAY